MNWDYLDSMAECMTDHLHFSHKGLSEKISLDYELVSDPPWVYFILPSDGNLSFMIHDLEFGLNYDNEESIFWHLSALDGRRANFEGFVDLSGFLGKRKIRGYIGTPDFKHRTGIVTHNGRVEEIRSLEDRRSDLSLAVSPSMEMMYLISRKN